MPKYEHTPAVNTNQPIDASALQGKTAIVTGGASGLGEAYVRALSAVGVYVIIGDLNENTGTKLATELEKATFIKCDVTKWEDQARLFKDATSLTGKIDYVVCNAGIAPADEVFEFAGDDKEPNEPDLKAIDVNLKGTLFTTKLALHYFIKQNGQTPLPQQRDTSLVLIGSGAAFLDCLRGPVYPATKWGVRGIMHSLRRTAHYHGTRVNMLSPWYVKTSILPEETWAHVKKSGVEFATVEDAGQALLRLLSDQSIQGRTFFISARKWASSGYIDFDIDDYRGGLLEEIGVAQMAAGPVDAGLFI